MTAFSVPDDEPHPVLAEMGILSKDFREILPLRKRQK